MYCSRCGRERFADEVYCAGCGQEHDAEPARSRRPLVVGATLAGLLVLGGGVALALTGSDPDEAEVVAVTATPAPTPSASPSPTPSPGAESFSDLYREVASGVVRIEATSCEGTGTGTGFLLEPDLVATVAHVVAGTASVTVQDGDSTVGGQVVGIDLAQELALVRLDERLDGHVFTLADRLPEVGDEVAAIGYPLSGDQSFTRGSVSGLDRVIEAPDISLDNLIQTDAAINPGNSGGPLLRLDGEVVGLVEAKRLDAESIAFAVPSTTAARQFRSWERDPPPVQAVGDCLDLGDPFGGNDAVEGVLVTDESGTEAGPLVAQALEQYAGGITFGDYDSAYAVLTPEAQSRTTRGAFEDGTRSSYYEDVRVLAVEGSGDMLTALTTFTTYQDPADSGEGQTCSTWVMAYELVPGDGALLIDRAVPEPGSPQGC